MYSIRNKLNVSIITGMIVLLSAVAVFLYSRVVVQIEQVFDTALYDKAQGLISLTEFDEEGLEFDFAEEGVMLEFQTDESPQYYQLWQQRDELLIKSPSLGTTDLPSLNTPLGQHQYADLILQDGRAGRLIEINFMPRVEMDDEEDIDPADIPPVLPIILVYARERETLNTILFTIGTTISGAIIAVLIFSALLIRRLIGKGLAPLSNLARQVSAIDESRLAERLNQNGPQSIEIAPIEKQLNHLLERLQSAFEREKRFSANVAHELRTPLSELKTLAEVGKMVPDDLDQIMAFFNDVGVISAQMEKVVITLLELARSEAGLLHSDPQDIELSSFCDTIWEHAVNGSGKTLEKSIVENLVVTTDREKFGIILSNLFMNAVSYSPENAKVHVTAKIRNDNVVVEVKNASTDLRPEDIVHMKDRFWRKQKTRSNSGNSGLGLTLVEALARVMSLDIKLELDDQKSFLVIISGLYTATSP